MGGKDRAPSKQVSLSLSLPAKHPTHQVLVRDLKCRSQKESVAVLGSRDKCCQRKEMQVHRLQVSAGQIDFQDLCDG